MYKYIDIYQNNVLLLFILSHPVIYGTFGAPIIPNAHVPQPQPKVSQRIHFRVLRSMPSAWQNDGFQFPTRLFAT
jgi:hypothetical protein